jgi:hypothetical protein
LPLTRRIIYVVYTFSFRSDLMRTNQMNSQQHQDMARSTSLLDMSMLRSMNQRSSARPSISCSSSLDNKENKPSSINQQYQRSTSATGHDMSNESTRNSSLRRLSLAHPVSTSRDLAAQLVGHQQLHHQNSSRSSMDSRLAVGAEQTTSSSLLSCKLLSGVNTQC